MPIVPGIILNAPNILVTQSGASSLGIENTQFGWILGTVEDVYDTSDKSSLGQTVYFDPTTVQSFIYGSTLYYIVDENFASFVEPLAP